MVNTNRTYVGSFNKSNIGIFDSVVLRAAYGQAAVV